MTSSRPSPPLSMLNNSSAPSFGLVLTLELTCPSCAPWHPLRETAVPWPTKMGELSGRENWMETHIANLSISFSFTPDGGPASLSLGMGGWVEPPKGAKSKYKKPPTCHLPSLTAWQKAGFVHSHPSLPPSPLPPSSVTCFYFYIFFHACLVPPFLAYCPLIFHLPQIQKLQH